MNETTTAPVDETTTTETPVKVKKPAKAKPAKPQTTDELPCTFRTVDPSEVVVGVNYGRGGYSNGEWDESVSKLAVSLKEIGQQEPILCREEDGKLIAVDGFRRLAACAKAKLPVKVRIDPNIKTESQAKVAAIVANVHEKPTVLQEAFIVESLSDEGWTLTRISKLFGRSNTNRTACLVKLLTAGDEVRELVHTGKVSLFAAVQVAGDEKAEKKLVADVAAGKLVTAVDAAEAKGGESEGEGESEGGETEKKPPKKNVSHLDKFLDEVDEDANDERAINLLRAVTKFLRGQTEQVIVNALKKFK